MFHLIQKIWCKISKKQEHLTGVISGRFHLEGGNNNPPLLPQPLGHWTLRCTPQILRVNVRTCVTKNVTAWCNIASCFIYGAPEAGEIEILLWFNEGKDVFSLNTKINCEWHTCICCGIVLRKTVFFLGPGFIVRLLVEVQVLNRTEII